MTKVGQRGKFVGHDRVRVDDGLIIVPDVGLTDTALDMLNLQDCRTLSAPGATVPECDDDDVPISDEDRPTYMSCVGVLIYLSDARSDVQFAATELARDLQKPTMR